MNTSTLADLVDRALDAADFTGSDFPVRARVVDYVNDALAELHDRLCDQEYWYATQNVTVVAGTEEYSLPDNFYKMLRVWRVSGSRRYPVDRFNLSDLAGYKNNGPTTGGTVQLWYAPQYKRIENDNDKPNTSLPEGWEQFAAYHAAVQLLNREESDSQALQVERQRALERIMRHVEPRDQGGPDTIEDVYGRWNRGVRDDEERHLRYRVMGSKLLLVDFDYLGV